MTKTDRPPYLPSDEWLGAIPTLHRMLAGDITASLTRPLEWSARRDYWFAAYYCMVVVLGWRNCTARLRRLLAPGVTHEGPFSGPIATLHAQWVADGQLQALHHFCSQVPDPIAGGRAGHEVGGDAAVLARAYGIASHDPLHLAHHAACIAEHLDRDQGHELPRPAEGVSVLRTDASRRAIILCDRFDDWPIELGRLGRALPKGTKKEPSWHAEVVVRPLGWIGDFRLCHDCGVWFQGKWTYHDWGHR